MKNQCDKHGCSELLCGCPVQVLELNSEWSEIIRAKDKYINLVLVENKKLLNKIKNLEEAINGTVSN